MLSTLVKITNGTGPSGGLVDVVDPDGNPVTPPYTLLFTNSYKKKSV